MSIAEPNVTEAYAFACLNCGHGWEQSYEIAHRNDASGRTSVTYLVDGAKVPSPLTRPTCGNCEGHLVRIMRAGQVSGVAARSRWAVRQDDKPKGKTTDKPKKGSTQKTKGASPDKRIGRWAGKRPENRLEPQADRRARDRRTGETGTPIASSGGLRSGDRPSDDRRSDNPMSDNPMSDNRQPDGRRSDKLVSDNRRSDGQQSDSRRSDSGRAASRPSDQVPGPSADGSADGSADRSATDRRSPRTLRGGFLHLRRRHESPGAA